MTRTRRLVLALVVDLTLVAGEATGAVFAHSTGLVATAGHDLADAAALGLALVATRLALRPATAARSFGYHRATILAALANATAIVVVALGVAALGAYRLAHPTHVQGTLVVIVAAGGLLGNAGAALLLREHRLAVGLGVPPGGADHQEFVGDMLRPDARLVMHHRDF